MSNDSNPHAAANEAQLAELRRLVARSAQALPLAADVRAKAVLMLLDTVGCMFAGRQPREMAAFEAALAAIEGGPFRFPGGAPLSTQAAAAVAAMASTWDEACEGLPYAHGRPGLALVGALLPLAVVRNATLDETLSSIVAGYEVGARAGGWLRIRPGMHVDGNWPALGVAAGVSRLLRLAAEQTLTAINIAACQLPTSLYLPIRTGDNARNTYLSHSAWLGMLAAFSASAGITAPPDALLHYAQGFADTKGSAAPAFDHPFLLEAYFKPHAGARHLHYGLDAAMRIRAELGGDSAAITGVRLRVYEEAATYAGNRNPRAPITGQFSLSFAVAAGLRYGAMEPEIFRDENFNDPELRRLEQLVQIEPDAALGAGGKRAAILIVEAAGRRFEARADRLIGDADQPSSLEDMIAKFVRYSSNAVTKEKAQRFATALTAGAGDAGLGELWAALS